MPKQPGSIRLAGSTLGEYRHVCAFFGNADEEYHALVPFIREGLDHGDRAVHVVPRDRQDHISRLSDAGIDVEAAQRSQQLEVLRPEQTYLRGGRFDQDAMLATMERVLESGRALGFPLTRLVAHAECVLEDWAGANAFVQYEARLNFVLPTYADVVICTYDTSMIGAGTVMDVLRTHPMVIIGGVLQQNPFFVSPDAFLNEVRERRSPTARSISA